MNKNIQFFIYIDLHYYSVTSGAMQVEYLRRLLSTILELYFM